MVSNSRDSLVLGPMRRGICSHKALAEIKAATCQVLLNPAAEYGMPGFQIPLFIVLNSCTPSGPALKGIG